jgi:D-proline reductase (dithiol) PrdA
MRDEEIDLVGVMLVGSPQANSDKFYVSRRLGQTVECMGIDGAIVTTEGFGNNHVDFASHIEQIGKRGVKVVGASYCAVQGALVVGNKYMGAMCDNNKSKQGIENEILSNNTLCEEDAVRQLAMLKTLLGGGEIKAAERKWNNNVKLNNIEIIEKTTGKKVPLVDNEQVLPKSKKRLEKYEPEA